MISWKAGAAGLGSWSEALTAARMTAALTVGRDDIIGERLQREFLVAIDDVIKMAKIMSPTTRKKICRGLCSRRRARQGRNLARG